MDKRNRASKIQEMLKPYIGFKVPIGRLQRLILENIGSSEKTIQECLRMMISYGYVVEVESFIFEVCDPNLELHSIPGEE